MLQMGFHFFKPNIWCNRFGGSTHRRYWLGWCIYVKRTYGTCWNVSTTQHRLCRICYTIIEGFASVTTSDNWFIHYVNSVLKTIKNVKIHNSYRAILGPFQWQVWIAIIFTYVFAIFPLAFSDRLTLSHLIGNWGEMENMFWYVFGTFTNSLTFTGEFSWSNTKKTSTRVLIGW